MNFFVYLQKKSKKINITILFYIKDDNLIYATQIQRKNTILRLTQFFENQPITITKSS